MITLPHAVSNHYDLPLSLGFTDYSSQFCDTEFRNSCRHGEYQNYKNLVFIMNIIKSQKYC
jgi:hypothetical protein